MTENNNSTGAVTVIAQAINGEIRKGDFVIAADNNDYAYLAGEVIEIMKLGTPEHAEEVDNDTDSVHVNFMALPYPPKRQDEILEYFYGLSNSYENLAYNELPLDDVIMASDMLIRITDLGDDRINALVCDYEEAKVFCNSITEGDENGGH